jgi:putative ABC transport system permease protein
MRQAFRGVPNDLIDAARIDGANELRVWWNVLMPVVIGSDYAHELWGNADPIGRRFRQVQGDKELERAAVVVGVYDATRGTTRGQGRRVFAVTSTPWHWAYLVKTSGPASALVGKVRDEVRKGVPQVPVLGVATLEDKYIEARALNVKAQSGITAAGALILLLASVGLYGVVGLAVLQRKREIGIRIALGATPTEVVAMLFRQGLRLGLTGMLVGLPLTVAAVTFLKSMMEGKTDGGGIAFSPLVAGPAIAIIVLIVTSIATWIPARRAAVVDPTLALRAE